MKSEVNGYINQFDIRISTVFDDPGRFLFFGYPGSGTAITVAKIATKLSFNAKQKYILLSCDPFQAGIGHKIKMLAYHLDMEYQAIERIADLEQLTGINNFIRLRCPTITTITDYQAVFHNPVFKKALVLDCTRKDDVNTALVRLIGKDVIDGVILTKIDLVQDKMAVYEYLSSLELPVAYLAYGERILYDGSFPTEKMVKDMLFEKKQKFQ
jgi:flagellar biosynthesis GTPase FlhF